MVATRSTIRDRQRVRDGDGAELIVQAELLARAAHHGVVNVKNGEDYILHPMRVAGRASAHGAGAQVVAVCWLHDVVEDTDVTLDDLRWAGFPERVVTAVDALTRRPGERADDYYDRVAAHPDAHAAKGFDIDDNTDPARLGVLDDKTRARLTRKYDSARAYLDMM